MNCSLKRLPEVRQFIEEDLPYLYPLFLLISYSFIVIQLLTIGTMNRFFLNMDSHNTEYQHGKHELTELFLLNKNDEVVEVSRIRNLKLFSYLRYFI